MAGSAKGLEPSTRSSSCSTFLCCVPLSLLSIWSTIHTHIGNRFVCLICMRTYHITLCKSFTAMLQCSATVYSFPLSSPPFPLNSWHWRRFLVFSLPVHTWTRNGCASFRIKWRRPMTQQVHYEMQLNSLKRTSETPAKELTEFNKKQTRLSCFKCTETFRVRINCV